MYQQLTLQLKSLQIQGLTDVPIQISTIDDCCRLSEFDTHSQTSDKTYNYVAILFCIVIIVLR